MDCFVFPSLHEGFPLTLIEAQASGLPCIVSDRITRAVKLNDNLTFCPLEYPPEKWTEKINALLAADRESVDCSRVKDDFDIKRTAKKLEELYLA
jgi:glycosyltransferase involved in cell wall biosynthesis